MSTNSITPPEYFARVANDARSTWDLLHQRPDLAGAWKHLFRQVQNPRFVVSELLQNADDAGATEAKVILSKEEFIFEHNGKDFNEQQFASLCRFGFSDKRTLHTIGFRGIGFKSTFSLGANVEVWSPTLGVRFHKTKFTEPEWIHDGRRETNTRIRVRLAGQHAHKEVSQNLLDWARSPASLLFFNNIRNLDLNGQKVERSETKPRSIPGARRVELRSTTKQDLLVFRSPVEPFPPEAIEEIREERDVEELHLGGCSVELVLGLSGDQRLFVVLPTVEALELPFSVNAPFLLKPDRFVIKPPSTSPTNRWLLDRVGRLAAQAMLAWLEQSNLDPAERVKAYQLLPESFESQDPASEAVIHAIQSELNEKPIVLTTYERLVAENVATISSDLLEVWSAKQAREMFASAYEHLVSPMVPRRALRALEAGGWIHEISDDLAIEQLKDAAMIPKPATWQKLGVLWDFLRRHSDSNPWGFAIRLKRALKIVPVMNSDQLMPAEKVVRLSTRKDALEPEVTTWLAGQTAVLDHHWVEWINKQRKKDEDEDESPHQEFLRELQLNEPTPPNRLVEQAAAAVFARKEVTIEECVKLAQVLAALGASIPQGFQFVTRDCYRRQVSHGIVFDHDGAVAELSPGAWAEEHILHEDYHTFTGCSEEAWLRWLASQNCSLRRAFPILRGTDEIYSRSSLEKRLRARGAAVPTEYPYQREQFTFIDFVIDSALVSHWNKEAAKHPDVWHRALSLILAEAPHAWSPTLSAQVTQRHGSNHKSVKTGPIVAGWLELFRDKPCLVDTHGQLHAPVELYRRTPDTEALLNIERFVQAEIDVEATRPVLKALGVLDTPADAGKLLDRIAALAPAPVTPVVMQVVSSLYQAIDRIVARCRPVDRANIDESFRTRKLVLAANSTWQTSVEISIFPAEDDESGSEGVIHPMFKDYSMWRRLGVAERPSSERTLEWLKTLTPGRKLDGAEQLRVRRAIQREAQKIWVDVGNWLSLDGTWEAVSSFQYRITMQRLPRWEALDPASRRISADFRYVPAHICEEEPFCNIPQLADAVEYRVTKVEPSRDGHPVPSWLRTLAEGLRRIRIGEGEQRDLVRGEATRMALTVWNWVGALEVTPYIANAPAGISNPVKVVWRERELLVEAGSAGRIHRFIVDELSVPFGAADLGRAISKAIDACAGRDQEFIQDYLAEHFTLEEDAPPLPDKTFEQPQQPEAEESTTSAEENAAATDEDSASQSPVDDLEDDEDLFDDMDGEEVDTPSTQTKRQPPAPSLFEKYALSQGFRPAGDRSGFVHADGRRIVKADDPFDWELIRDGQTVQRYWVSRRSFHDGVELPAELWTMTKHEPNETTWVVMGEQGSPRAFLGRDVVAQTDTGALGIFPAQFRIVQTHK